MKRPGLVLAMRLLGLGWYIAASIVLGVGGGLLVDRLLGTVTRFSLLGVVVGSVVGRPGVSEIEEARGVVSGMLSYFSLSHKIYYGKLFYAYTYLRVSAAFGGIFSACNGHENQPVSAFSGISMTMPS